MTDDDFVPHPVPPMRSAIPIARAGDPPPRPEVSVQETPPAHAPVTLRDPSPKPKRRGKDPVRVARAKAVWARRRRGEEIAQMEQYNHPLPDRHAVEYRMTIAEAIELALLIEKHPLLKKVLLP